MGGGIVRQTKEKKHSEECVLKCYHYYVPQQQKCTATYCSPRVAVSNAEHDGWNNARIEYVASQNGVNQCIARACLLHKMYRPFQIHCGILVLPMSQKPFAIMHSFIVFLVAVQSVQKVIAIPNLVQVPSKRHKSII